MDLASGCVSLQAPPNVHDVCVIQCRVDLTFLQPAMGKAKVSAKRVELQVICDRCVDCLCRSVSTDVLLSLYCFNAIFCEVTPARPPTDEDEELFGESLRGESTDEELLRSKFKPRDEDSDDHGSDNSDDSGSDDSDTDAAARRTVVPKKKKSMAEVLGPGLMQLPSIESFASGFDPPRPQSAIGRAVAAVNAWELKCTECGKTSKEVVLC